MNVNNNIDANVISTVNQNSADKAKVSASDDLKNNFMTLLITQLQNQDPLKPLENAELTSQLAQINTVNGIEDLNKTMTNITSQISAGQQLQATALIGRGVLVEGDKVLVGNGVTTPFGFELASAADTVNLSIVDAGGVEIRRFELGAMTAGIESFTWDGKLEDGSVAPDGAYRFKAEASYGGVAQNITSLNYAVVSGVKKTEAGTVLDLGVMNEQVTLADVKQIL